MCSCDIFPVATFLSSTHELVTGISCLQCIAAPIVSVSLQLYWIIL